MSGKEAAHVHYSSEFRGTSVPSGNLEDSRGEGIPHTRMHATEPAESVERCERFKWEPTNFSSLEDDKAETLPSPPPPP